MMELMKWAARLTTVILAVMLALPTVGCQQQDQEKENGQGLDVQVDVGKTKVEVKRNKKPDEKGSRLDVDLEHHPGHEHESGDQDQ